jgi:hypothetical protein
MFSTDVRLAFAPSATYRQLIAQNSPTRWWRALARPALVLVLIAVVVPMMATSQITARLVLTSAAAWSPVVVIQMAIAAIFVAPARGVGFWRAIDLWFAGHVPYSLWILLLPFLTGSSALPPHDVMGVSMVAPLVWTSVITSAFFRTVLGMHPWAARRRAALHLAIVVIVVLALVLWAAGGIAGTLGYVVRRWDALWS